MGLTLEQRARIVAETREWIGTPYVGWSRVKGPNGGTDCGQLIAGVYQNCRLAPMSMIIPRSYSLQVAQHRRDTEYIDKIKEYMREIPESEVLPGDVVVYMLGLAYAHAGIVESWPEHILHTIDGHGVTGGHGTGHPKFRKRRRKFFTLKDEFCVTSA